MVFNARVKINWKLLLRLFLRRSWRFSFCLHSGLNKNYFTRTYPWFFAAYRTRDTQAEKNAILPVFFFFFLCLFFLRAFSIRHNRFSPCTRNYSSQTSQDKTRLFRIPDLQEIVQHWTWIFVPKLLRTELSNLFLIIFK